MILKNKPILSLNYGVDLDNPITERFWNDYTSGIYYAGDKSNIDNIIKANRGTITSNSVIYFGKTSKFPRFKLSASDLKRCIKVDKANIVAININFQNVQRVCNYTILEDESYYYFINNYTLRQAKSLHLSVQTAWTSDCLQYIQNNHVFYGTNIKKIYEGDCYLVGKSMAEDLENILNGTYKNIVTDNDIDAFINNKQDTLTREDLESITSMLDSTDESSREVGLKMLLGYNVNDVKLTVRILLGTRPYLKYCACWNSVGIKQIRETINWIDFGDIIHRNWHILQADKPQNYTEYDLELSKEASMDAVKKYMKEKIEALNRSKLLDTLNINVTYDVS